VNTVLLLALNIDLYFRKNERRGRGGPDILLFCDAKQHIADDLLRTVGASKNKLEYSNCSSVADVIRQPDKNVPIAVLTEDESNLLKIKSECSNPIIAPIVPETETIEYGFFRELEGHDFEIGGLNEWNGAPTLYSQYVLQSLSRASCRMAYPAYAIDEITKLAAFAEGTRLRVLDVGCGPISRLRWGALTGEMEIVGVDPLNDLYNALLARHGFDGLAEIRPTQTFNDLIETVDLGGEKFAFVYSCDALGHTQDPVKFIQAISTALDSRGMVVLNTTSREGKRNGYARGYKFDIWYDGALRYSTEEQQPRNLLEDVGTLMLDRVYWANDDSLCLSLRLAPSLRSSYRPGRR
jgi:SAM-dependent methyltransferase